MFFSPFCFPQNAAPPAGPVAEPRRLTHFTHFAETHNYGNILVVYVQNIIVQINDCFSLICQVKNTSLIFFYFFQIAFFSRGPSVNLEWSAVFII